jgi:undecaprenyl-diphosphatase
MKLAPIMFAAGVAGVTWWRWRQLGWPLRAAAAALCVALALYGAGVVRPPQLETAAGTIGSTLGPYTYALVAVMAFLETGAFTGLIVPGETVVIVGGVVAGQGHINLVGLLGLTWCCALAGDVTGYFLGRRLGRRFLLEHCAGVGITESRLQRVEAFFARYGLAAILVARFIGVVRPIAPFLAGACRYRRGRFLGLAVVGTGLWSAAFVLLGFMFWHSFDDAVAIAKRGTLALGITVALAVAIVVSYRVLRTRLRAGTDPRAGRQGRSRRGRSKERLIGPAMPTREPSSR